MDRLTMKHGEELYESLDPIDVLKNEYSMENYKKLIKRLGEYEDLEEQNRLLKLPCAVGDTVYTFSFEKIFTLCVDSFVIYTDGIDARLSSKMKEYEFLKIDIDIADFGKKWFATQEEAEAALKELEGRAQKRASMLIGAGSWKSWEIYLITRSCGKGKRMGIECGKTTKIRKESRQWSRNQRRNTT